MNNIVIRQYQKSDRVSVRKIAWDTAFIGEPASAFFEGQDVFCDFLTKYFTDYEPESCFVAELDGKIIGYVIGAKDTHILAKKFLLQIFPILLACSFLKGVFFSKKNTIFFFNLFRSIFCGEFKMPDFSKEYPATLHINLAAGFRHIGVGSRLLQKYCDYLKIQGVKAVQLATMSEQAAEFFVNHGFSQLFSGKRTYFKYLTKKDIPIYIYGKKII
ncbi:MAG: GNAT family N-acetyltransferase [Candidatus Omnitrophica bacterium]|nr:GNAT family N-acetyltransferase [Candidatus Omnitrophota bacterium]